MKCWAIKKEREYEHFVTRTVAGDGHVMTSLSKKEVRPKHLMTKLRGGNSELCHNVGAFLTQVAVNVPMLVQTLDKITISGEPSCSLLMSE